MPPTADATTNTCPQCGNALQPRMLRCRNCGYVPKTGSADSPRPHPLGSNGGPQASPQRPAPPNQNSTPTQSGSRQNAPSPASAGGTFIDDILEGAAAGDEVEQSAPPQSPPAVPPAPPQPPQPSPAASEPPPQPGGIDISDIVDRASAGHDPLSYTDENAPPNRPESPPASANNARARRSGRHAVAPQGGQQADESLEQETSLPESRTDAAHVVWLSCKCGRKLRAKRSLAGKRFKCRKCGAALVVPAQATDETLPPAAPTKSFAEFAEELKSQPAKAPDETETVKKLARRRFRKLSQTVAKADRTDPDGLAKCKQAVRELAESGDSRSLEFLLPLLSDESTSLRVAVVEALGVLKSGEAVPPLVALLDEEDPAIGRATVKALGAIGDRRAVRPLIVVGMFVPHLKHSAADAIVAIGEAAVPVLLDALNDDDPGTVFEAVVLLGRLQAAKAIKALALIMETRSGVFRAHAAEALGLIGDKRAAGALCRQLRDPDPGVRTNVAAALARLADPGSLKPLLAALDDEDPDVQKYAAAALGKIGDRQATAALCQRLTSPHDEVCIAAVEALGDLGDEGAVTPLLKLLAGKHEAIVLKVAGALKKLKDPRAVEALIEILYHPNPAVRQRAADSLGSIGDAVSAEHLETLLKTDRSQEVRVAAAKALGEIGDPASIDTLEEAVYDEFAVRCRAVVALGQIGDEAALPVLLAMLRDPLPEVRYHAAGALAEITHANAIAPLQELLEDEGDAMVLRGIEKALERLAEVHSEQVGEIKVPTKKSKQKSRKKASGRKLLSALIPYQLAVLVPQTPRGRLIALGLLAAGPLLYGLFSLGSLLTPADRVVPRGRVASLAFSADGKMLGVGRTFGLVEFWEVESGELEWKRASDVGKIAGLAFGPDQETVVLAGGPDLRLWREGDSEASVLDGHRSTIVSVTATPDGSKISSRAEDGTLIFWDVQTGKAVSALALQTSNLSAATVNHDATLAAAATASGQAALFDATGMRLHKYEGAKGAIGALTFSADGKQIAAGASDGSVMIWDVETEALATKLSGEVVRACQAIQYLAGGKQLAVFRDPFVEVWNLDAQQARQFKVSGPDQINAVAFSPDGALLAISGEENSAIWLFDVATGEQKHRMDVSR